MKKIEKLCLEQIGDDLCVVFKTDRYRFRDILGTIDPAKLDELARSANKAAEEYRTRNRRDFSVTLID